MKQIKIKTLNGMFDITGEDTRDNRITKTDQFSSFKTSYGCFDKFRAGYKILHHVICGESASIDVLIPIIIIMQRIFFKAMPDRSLSLYIEKIAKMVKDRRNVSLF